jgi:hypothetical protein
VANEPQVNAVKEYTCPLCPYTSRQQVRHLANHIMTSHGYDNGRDNNGNNSNNGNNNLKCTHCPMTFSAFSCLTAHVASAHSEHALPNKFCPLCPYITNFSGHLIAPVKAVHSRIKDIKCHHCPKTFSHISNQIRHTKQVHRPTKTCSMCPYTTRRHAGYLMDHVKTMHKKMRNQCMYCSMEFSELCNLKDHVQKVHNIKIMAALNKIRKANVLNPSPQFIDSKALVQQEAIQTTEVATINDSDMDDPGEESQASETLENPGSDPLFLQKPTIETPEGSIVAPAIRHSPGKHQTKWEYRNGILKCCTTETISVEKLIVAVVKDTDHSQEKSTSLAECGVSIILGEQSKDKATLKCRNTETLLDRQTVERPTPVATIIDKDVIDLGEAAQWREELPECHESGQSSYQQKRRDEQKHKCPMSRQGKIRDHRCHICPSTFSRASTLKVHIKRAHGQTEPTNLNTAAIYGEREQHTTETLQDQHDLGSKESQLSQDTSPNFKSVETCEIGAQPQQYLFNRTLGLMNWN